MAKSTNDAVLDLPLADIVSNGTRITFCSAEPTTYTEAITTFALADVDVTSGDYTGPAAGTTSGRRITVNAQTGIPVDTTGTANHVSIVDVPNTTLKHVSDFTAQAVTSGNTINMSAWDIEYQDPT